MTMTRTMTRSLSGLAATVVAAVVMSFVTPAQADTEEPRFSVIDKIGVIEVRQYGARLAADVVVQGDEESARSDVSWPITSSATTRRVRRSR
jgi:hypothetical protein